MAKCLRFGLRVQGSGFRVCKGVPDLHSELISVELLASTVIHVLVGFSVLGFRV